MKQESKTSFKDLAVKTLSGIVTGAVLFLFSFSYSNKKTDRQLLDSKIQQKLELKSDKTYVDSEISKVTKKMDVMETRHNREIDHSTIALRRELDAANQKLDILIELTQ